MRRSLSLCSVCLLLALLAPVAGGAEETVLFEKDLAVVTDIIDEDAVTPDDGGLLAIAARPRVVQLAVIENPDVEAATVSFSADLRAANLQGLAYLEMWCRFPGKGEFFSRGLNAPLTGETSWTSQTIPFHLKAGENPDRIRLNLIINGSGDVWIDNLRVSAAPLP